MYDHRHHNLDLIRSCVTSLWKIGLSSRTGLKSTDTVRMFPVQHRHHNHHHCHYRHHHRHRHRHRHRHCHCHHHHHRHHSNHHGWDFIFIQIGSVICGIQKDWWHILSLILYSPPRLRIHRTPFGRRVPLHCLAKTAVAARIHREREPGWLGDPHSAHKLTWLTGDDCFWAGTPKCTNGGSSLCSQLIALPQMSPFWGCPLGFAPRRRAQGGAAPLLRNAGLRTHYYQCRWFFQN